MPKSKIASVKEIEEFDEEEMPMSDDDFSLSDLED